MDILVNYIVTRPFIEVAKIIESLKDLPMVEAVEAPETKLEEVEH